MTSLSSSDTNEVQKSPVLEKAVPTFNWADEVDDPSNELPELSDLPALKAATLSDDDLRKTIPKDHWSNFRLSQDEIPSTTKWRKEGLKKNVRQDTHTQDKGSQYSDSKNDSKKNVKNITLLKKEKKLSSETNSLTLVDDLVSDLSSVKISVASNGDRTVSATTSASSDLKAQNPFTSSKKASSMASLDPDDLRATIIASATAQGRPPKTALSARRLVANSLGMKMTDEMRQKEQIEKQELQRRRENAKK